MSDVAIIVENLSKRYRIGLQEQIHETFLGALASWLKTPISNFSRLQKLSRFKEEESSEDIIWALKDVSFNVNRGEVLGIIGRNGAGKSTLLKILSQITEPTFGRVILHGRVSSLLEVGTGFHPELTGRENIFLSGAILGMSKAEIKRKYNEIVAFAEIQKFIDTPVKRYSSGMRVRLAFSVAAHLESDIMLIDEVLAVGDIGFQKKCLSKMGEIGKEGRTVLFVSHNMSAISNLTNSCFCIHDGRIVDYGETDHVIKNYISRIGDQVTSYGMADLTSVPHVSAFSGDMARIEWVRTSKVRREQTSIFFEGEPIRIEIGFNVKHEKSSIELAYSVRSMDNSPLCISASGQRKINHPGRYSLSSLIEPNYLQAGIYNINLVLLVAGQKEDAVAPAIQFTIESRLSKNDNPFYITWGRGFYYRFDSEWGQVSSFKDDL